MNKNNKLSKLPSSQILLYASRDGEAKIEVKLENETVWLTQAQMAQLFQTDRTSIVKHIQNIFESGELDQATTCAKFAQHLPDGRTYQVTHYMLKEELEILYLLVEQFMSFAELQIKLQRPMYMKDWREYLNDFLKLNKLEILKSKGSISHEQMEKIVSREMRRYQRLLK